MKVTFLGTNGWYDTDTGCTSSVLIETGDRYIIFDAGSGFRKAKDLVRPDKKVALFISHLHLDHLIGLHTLPLFRFSKGIDVFTPKGFDKLLKGFLKRPFTSPPSSLATKLRFHSLDGRCRPDFDLEARKLFHSVPCYGYKITIEGKSVAYCTDTGVCGNLKRLAKNTDLLITECAMAPHDKTFNPFHLTPEAAATVAAASGTGRLALFHFDPGKYPSFSDRRAAQSSAVKIFTDTIAANDGTEIIV